MYCQHNFYSIQGIWYCAPKQALDVKIYLKFSKCFEIYINMGHVDGGSCWGSKNTLKQIIEVLKLGEGSFWTSNKTHGNNNAYPYVNSYTIIIQYQGYDIVLQTRFECQNLLEIYINMDRVDGGSCWGSQNILEQIIEVLSWGRFLSCL